MRKNVEVQLEMHHSDTLMEFNGKTFDEIIEKLKEMRDGMFMAFVGDNGVIGKIDRYDDFKVNIENDNDLVVINIMGMKKESDEEYEQRLNKDRKSLMTDFKDVDAKYDRLKVEIETIDKEKEALGKKKKGKRNKKVK